MSKCPPDAAAAELGKEAADKIAKSTGDAYFCPSIYEAAAVFTTCAQGQRTTSDARICKGVSGQSSAQSHC